MNNKTFKKAGEQLNEALDGLVCAISRALKIDRLLDWLTKKLNKK